MERSPKVIDSMGEAVKGACSTAVDGLDKFLDGIHNMAAEIVNGFVGRSEASTDEEKSGLAFAEEKREFSAAKGYEDLTNY